MSALGFLVVALSLAGVTTWLVALVAWPGARRVPARHVPAVISALLALGAAVTLAAVIPSHATGCHCDADAAAVVHLCVAHPERVRPLLPLALALVLLLSVRPSLVVARLVRARRVVRALLARAQPMPGADPALLVTDVPMRNALAVGGTAGRVVADRAWWEGLQEWERRAVLEHEKEHLRRRDPLALAVLSLAASWLPPRLAGSLLDRWKLRAEQAADAAAARAIGDPVAVADLLVRQHRPAGSSLAAWPALTDGRAIEQRVQALLDEAPALDAHAGTGLLLPATIVLGALGAAWLAAPAVHELTESLIGWMR